ncbi:non-ribosomal peptide synthetase family protein [Tumebacillus algifaecis]|nr:thioester reductase domain-containing protein [Tumebacillus algifaecis]
MLNDDQGKGLSGKETADNSLASTGPTQASDSLKNFFANHWQSPLPVLEMSTDFSRAQKKATELRESEITLSAELTEKLRNLSNSTQTSLSSVVLAAFSVLLHRYSRADEMMIGVHNSALTETSEARNFLLPLRLDFSQNSDFSEVLAEINIAALVAQTCEMEQLIADHSAQNAEFQHAAFPACFAMENGKRQGHIRALKQVGVEIGLTLKNTKTDLRVSFTYDGGLYESSTIKRMLQNFQTLLHSITEAPKTLVSELHMLSEVEMQLLASFNETEAFFPSDKTIIDVFEEQVLRTPDNIAVRYQDEELTYVQLNEKANQLAHALRACGCDRDSIIAIMVNRSMEMIISVLGVLKAGGAYLPIDPDAPQARIDYLLEDSNALLIITKDFLLDKLIGFNGEVFSLDSEMPVVGTYPTTAVASETAPEDLAYVIYTSGSTGKPKGTMLHHRGLCNLAVAQGEFFELHEKSRVLQFISLAFDPSVMEVFFTLTRGATLIMAPSHELKNAEALTDLLEREAITFFVTTPSMLSQLPLEAGPNLEVIVTGGDACPVPLAELWSQRVHYINNYGPTETTVSATGWSSRGKQSLPNPLPIGRALQNTEVYLLDSHLNLVPIGACGELYIGGAGVARGYFRRPELTAEKFISNPFRPGEKMYKTGDLGRMLPDGNIEFQGRIDNQVKIRGYRIELGEIEAALLQHPQIKEGIVIASVDPIGQKRLVAYVVTEQPVRPAEIQAFLAESLSDYMVPAYVINIPSIPVTINGKIDHRALPSPEDVNSGGDEVYVAPQNDVQRLIAEVWQEILGVKQVGIHDNFFAMGGHSLNILPCLVKLKPYYPTLTIQDFYKHPTVAELELRIAQDAACEIALTQFEQFIVQTAEGAAAGKKEAVCRLKLQKPNVVFLTGATGYLGSHILHDLLKDTDAHIYCLIRPSKDVTPQERLLETVDYYFGHAMAEEAKERVTALSGDLTQEGLGLSEEEREIVYSQSDAVIHCGADVRYYGDEEHFQQVNVRSTEQLLDIARRREGVRFHYVSTLSIMGPNETDEEEYVVTEGDFDRGQTFHNLYCETKFRAEKLVREAIKQGVLCTVYRVGNLVGHSVTGRFQRNIESNAFYQWMKATLMLETTPEDPNYVDMTPVNYCSKALVHSVMRKDTISQTLHLCNPKQIKTEKFISIVQGLGYSILTMDSQDYMWWLFQDNDSPKHHEALQLIFAHFNELNTEDPVMKISCKATKKLLAGSNIVCPEPDRELIYAILKHAINIGYLPASKHWALLETLEAKKQAAAYTQAKAAKKAEKQLQFV